MIKCTSSWVLITPGPDHLYCAVHKCVMTDGVCRVAELEAALRPFAELHVAASIDGLTTTVRVPVAAITAARSALSRVCQE